VTVDYVTLIHPLYTDIGLLLGHCDIIGIVPVRSKYFEKYNNKTANNYKKILTCLFKMSCEDDSGYVTSQNYLKFIVRSTYDTDL